jgi:flagellar biosynthetic protein FliR
MPPTLHLLSLFLIFVRILAVLMTAPLFSNRSVPTIAKIGFAGLLSLILLPVPGAPASAHLDTLPANLLPFALMVAQEVLIGAVIGFVSNLVFMAVGIAASMMGLQAGFRAANLFNPFTNVSSSSLNQFYTLMAIALFLTIDGHHWLISALVRTFKVAPLGTFVFNNTVSNGLITLTNEAFIAGARLALPVVGTLLLTDLGLGLIARAVPQVQVFFVGLPLKMGLGLLTLALTLSLTLPIVKELFSDAVLNMLAVISQ